MRLSFRLKLFLAWSLMAATALGIATVLAARALSRDAVLRIERALVAETRLAAELLTSSAADVAPASIDAQADRLGEVVGARVTLIAADGTVLGDSAEDGESLRALENHANRAEVADARQRGLGVSRRYSTTVNADMLYVAVPTKHRAIAIVRLALPLTDIREQVGAVRRASSIALGIALAIALALAWGVSFLLSARLRSLAATARKYAEGGTPPRREATGGDEIDQLAHALDEAFADVAARMAELEQSRGRLEAILAGMVEGVIVVDASGRMQLVNQSARQMLGIDPTDGGGATEGEAYLHAIRHPEIVAQVESAMRGRGTDVVEIVLSHRRVIASRAVPLVKGGAVLVLHDITRLKHADEVRRDFVANVSHELRTPLTAIRGYAEALRDEALAARERTRFLDIIDRHTERMTRLVHDLLRLARLEAGQEATDRALCDIADVLERTVGDLRARADAKRQRMVCAVSDGAEHLVTDASKLEDILRNLVENAISYAPEGSEIQLEAARRDGQYHLRVLDEGPGIPPSALRRIFERFYRVDKARSRESGGTGLGLSIVKHLAERLGGEVHAANRPGGGASFTLVLPDEARTGDDAPPHVTQI